jgi:hypothetical protein
MGRERTGFVVGFAGFVSFAGFEGRALAAETGRFFANAEADFLGGDFRIDFLEAWGLCRAADTFFAFFTDFELELEPERGGVFLRAAPGRATGFFFSFFLLLLAIRLQHRFPAASHRLSSTETHPEAGRVRMW